MVQHYRLVLVRPQNIEAVTQNWRFKLATPNERLAASLAALRKLQKGARRVFQSQELSRVHRERLLQNGFLQEVLKGWLISSSPDAQDGDSTPWYASFWEFCARYCGERFAGGWHLSPEQSLLLHAEKNVIPTQVIVHSPKATIKMSCYSAPPSTISNSRRCPRRKT